MTRNLVMSTQMQPGWIKEIPNSPTIPKVNDFQCENILHLVTDILYLVIPSLDDDLVD